MSLVIDVLSWILLSLGSVFVVVGGIGAIRLPDVYTRIHAVSLTDTTGALLVIAGIMLQSGLTLATLKLAAILVFLLLTGPTASYALANAALMFGIKPKAAQMNEEDK